MTETIYIPGFGNQDDRIRQKVFPEAKVLQKSLRIISPQQVENFLNKRPKEAIKNHIMRKYPNTDIKDFEFLYEEFSKFQGLTPRLDFAVKSTKRALQEIMGTDCMIRLAGHSQGGLIAIDTLIRNGMLIDNVESIDLFAPVVNSNIASCFHTGKQFGYLHRKGVLVRRQYISSLKKCGSDYLELLILMLRNRSWRGQLTIHYSKNDPVIPADSLNLGKLKAIYKNLRIIEHNTPNHYLIY